jgi:hypothetical protein
LDNWCCQGNLTQGNISDSGFKKEIPDECARWIVGEAMGDRTKLRLIFLVAAMVCGGLAARRVYIGRLFDTESVEIIAHLLPGSARSGASRSSVKYSFTVPDGRSFTNSQGGYSGNVGDGILVEYVKSRPEWNRVVGSGRTENRWPWIFGIPAGVFLLIAVRLRTS